MYIAVTLNGDEHEIISACVRKERWAQKEVYETYYGAMYVICARYAKNEHEALDILHEGFIKVFRYVDRYQIGTSLYSWIKRIMVNVSIDYYRKETRRKTEELDTVHQAVSKDVSADSKMTQNEILESIQRLSAAYRNVFNLYVIEGYSHKEVGELLGISESTSRSNLVKARSKLRIMLEKRGITWE